MTFPRAVLITGGCGFLGRHFAKYLADKGCSITLVDDLSSGLHPDKWPSFLAFPQASFVQADIREYLKEEKRPFDLALHLAAVVGGRAVIEGEPERNAASLELDAVFFRWAAAARPAQIIYMSSPVVYPVALQGKGTRTALAEELVDMGRKEASFGMPDLVYGWGKLTGEFLAATFAEKYFLNVFCPRPFSGYGADQDMSYPVPAICRRAVQKENPLVVWGSGEQSRDFIYVDDIIEGVFSFLPRVKGYQTMNLGSGAAATFLEVARIAADIAGYKPEIKTLSDKPEGVKARVADISKMKQYYTPKISLREGLERVISFLKQ